MFVLYLIFSAIAIGDAAWWRWADAKLATFRRGRGLARLALALFVGSQLVYLAYFLIFPRSARRAHPWVPTPFLAGVYIWSLLVLPVSLVGAGVGRLLGRLRRSTPHPLEDLPVASEPGLSRREMLGRVAVVAPPIITALGVARAMPQLDEFVVRRLSLNVPDLPRALDGMTIAHVSDAHVGRYTRPGLLPRIAQATNALRADLVLFTGDLIDLSIDDLPRGIEFMKQLDPRQGLAMIEGNHDLIENPNAFDDQVKASGLPLLIDEAMTVRVRGQAVQLLGTRWGAATGNRRAAKPADFAASVGVLQAKRDPAAFPILLAHHPHAFDPAAAAGFPLTLSGHTHGGQLMLSETVGFGPLFYRYWSGPYAKPNSQLVVNNGVGNWFPLRVNAPAEIIHLTLRCPA